MKGYLYHQWSVSDIANHFETDIRVGLSAEKASFRLQKNGANSLEHIKPISAASIFFRQFSNLFILLLFSAAIISYLIDGSFQTIVLFGVIIVNLGLGFFQEYKAEKSIEELKRSYRSTSTVIRNGQAKVIENEGLVVGDIVEITAGNKVPADLRLVEDESLSVDESTLTGESLPVSKNTKIYPLDTSLPDRKNMLYASTLAVSGHGRGIVVAIGKNTEFGKIAGLVGNTNEKTPLEKQIIYLSKVLGFIALILATVIFALGLFRELEIWQLLTFTIALLVGMVPESLPTAITLALALGVSRMARKKAIVRRLSVIEALGSVSIIATDKTGTLTQNNLSVSRLDIFNRSVLKRIDLDKKIDLNDSQMTLLLSEGLACSNINFDKEKKGEFIGDPIDKAIADSVSSLGMSKSYETKKYRRLMEIPFDSDKKHMAVLVNSNSGKKLIAKGSPEKIADFCSLTPTQKKEILGAAEEMSRSGFKVIALASKTVDSTKMSTLKGLSFRGLFSLIDKPSAGVRDAIFQAITAGIRPVIITGDHPGTAKYVAEKVGLKANEDEIITSKELASLSKTELKKYLETAKIFARVTPEEKINIISMFRKNNYSVAMVGDGTNDAPALKEADVSIAMGLKGTDVAKDASDIILSDDKYGTIISAIEYGRAIYDNIRNVIVLLISGNFNEVILTICSFIFGLPVPLLTIQILWANLITEEISALSLSFEKPSRHVLREKPRLAGVNSLRVSIYYSIVIAVISFISTFILYLWGLNHSIAKARTLVFCMVVFTELSYAFSIRSKFRIWESPKAFFENRYLVLSGLFVIFLQLIIFAKPIAGVFGIVPLNISEIMAIAISVGVSFIGAEIARVLFRKK